jgi:hypothetical protein
MDGQCYPSSFLAHTRGCSLNAFRAAERDLLRSSFTDALSRTPPETPIHQRLCLDTHCRSFHPTCPSDDDDDVPLERHQPMRITPQRGAGRKPKRPGKGLMIFTVSAALSIKPLTNHEFIIPSPCLANKYPAALSRFSKQRTLAAAAAAPKTRPALSCPDNEAPDADYFDYAAAVDAYDFLSIYLPTYLPTSSRRPR